ncbi:MAG: AAA family ATPase, partial [Phaeodactylibacter sp.]|nr:AAA family ATPase [Phaeodactylibacter sp.]
MLPKLPIGQQDFRGIAENDYLYVDKTRLIHQLVTSGKYYFLSRPRRFGKSLTLSVIKELFLGSRELFKGLWVENKARGKN